VNNNTESRNFMSYYGGQGRTLVFRIRWLGGCRNEMDFPGDGGD